MLFGAPKKPYSQFVADSWAQVRKQDEASLMHLRMPKPEARVHMDTQTPSSPGMGAWQAGQKRNNKANDKYEKRKAEVAENNSATQRWKRKIDHMMATRNPDLQDVAMKNLLGQQQRAEQQKAKDKRDYANSNRAPKTAQVGGQTPGYSQTVSWDPETNEWKNLGRERQTMAKTGSLQEMDYINSIEDPERQKQEMLRLFPDYLDAGTHWEHKTTGHKISKNLGRKEHDEDTAIAETKYLNGYGDESMQREVAGHKLQTTMDNVQELMSLTNYGTTGLASWANWIPGTDASEWKEIAEVIKNQIGMDAIAEMKGQSTTGATGLGAMNERELIMLQQRLGSLSATNSPAMAKKHLAKIHESLVAMQEQIELEQTNGAEKYNSLYDKWRGDGSSPKVNTDRYLPSTPSLPLTIDGARQVGDEWEDDEYYYLQRADGPVRSKK